MKHDPLALGATLYVPATRPDIVQILTGGAVPGLRSAVLCLEDSIAGADAPRALDGLASLLRPGTGFGATSVFVRPRGPEMLARIVRMPGASRLAGFVLPKVTAATLPDYATAGAWSDTTDASPRSRASRQAKDRARSQPTWTRSTSPSGSVR